MNSIEISGALLELCQRGAKRQGKEVGDWLLDAITFYLTYSNRYIEGDLTEWTVK